MYVKFSPNMYVLRYRKGSLVQKGPGLSFHCLDRSTSVCAVPVTGIDADFIFSQQTQDFQNTSVQGQLTFRFADYENAAAALDFTVNPHNQKYSAEPIPKASKRIINLAEVLVRAQISAMTLTQALAESRALAERVFRALQDEPQLKSMGVEITGFTVLRIAADKDTTRALEAVSRSCGRQTTPCMSAATRPSSRSAASERTSCRPSAWWSSATATSGRPSCRRNA